MKQKKQNQEQIATLESPKYRQVWKAPQHYEKILSDENGSRQYIFLEQTFIHIDPA